MLFSANPDTTKGTITSTVTDLKVKNMGQDQSRSLEEDASKWSKVLVVGETNSGKSTFINLMKNGYFAPDQSLSSKGIEVQSIVLNGHTVSFTEIGGEELYKPFWVTSMESTDGLIFIIDSSDFFTIKLAVKDLANLVKNYPHKPVLILMSKCDLEVICCEEAIRNLVRRYTDREDITVVKYSGISGLNMPIVEGFIKSLPRRKNDE